MPFSDETTVYPTPSAAPPTEKGMLLIDHFAGQALVALIRDGSRPHLVSELAYRIAEDMMRERAERQIGVSRGLEGI